MDIHRAFMHGADILAKDQLAYTAIHKGHGIEESHWDLLTQDEVWSPDQTRSMRSIIANVLEVAMTIAGMPAIPLPGQYAAALISRCVAPVNRMLACTKCPDTFDAASASGIQQEMEIKPMKVEQLMSLVLAYSGGFAGEPVTGKVPTEIASFMSKENQEAK